MDNRKLDKAKQEANLKEIINDDTPIAEDVATENDATKAEEAAKVDEEVVTEETDETPDVVEGTPETPDKEEPVDFKKKYSDSTREATNLYFKNKQMTDTVDKAAALPEPTEEELITYAKKQGAVFGDLDEFSQNILKKTLLNEKKFDMIHSTTTANKALDEWAGKIDTYTNSPETLAKYPSMVDHEVAFKKYCMKESRRGMEVDDLVGSFLFSVESDIPAPKRRKKKSMLLKGGGGGDSAPKPKELTAEETRIIRTKDPRRYERLVKEGKVGLSLLDRE